MLPKKAVIISKDKEEHFRVIVNDYELMVRNTCYGFVSSIDDAHDLAQDVFIEVWKNLDFFRGDSKLSTWIYRIAVNKSLNHLRQYKNNVILCALESLKENLCCYETDLFHDEKEEHKIKIKLLHKAIGGLPERQKSVFVLFYYEGLDYKEIAKITDSSSSVVESLLFRARLKLKKKIKYRYEKSRL